MKFRLLVTNYSKSVRSPMSLERGQKARLVVYQVTALDIQCLLFATGTRPKQLHQLNEAQALISTSHLQAKLKIT